MLQGLRRLAPVPLLLAVVLGPAPRAALAAGPDFSLSASPPSVAMPFNGSTTTTITVTPSGGFNGGVALSVSGLPAGVSASFFSTPNPAVTALDLGASGSPAGGTTTITVTGTSGSLAHSLSIPLTVIPPVSDFGIFVSPNNGVIVAGSSATFTVGATPLTGFTGTVTFSASGLPAGVTASFSPTVTSSNGASSATLTLTIASTAPPATSTIIVTGHAGSVTAMAAMTIATTVPTGGVVAAPAINANGPWFDEDDVRISNPAPLTALSVTIVIQRTTGVSFNSQYNSVGGQIVQSSSSTAAALTYQFTLAPGQLLNPGPGWTFAAQASGSGTAHPTTGDTFTVTYTTGGATFTQSGHYPASAPVP